MDRAVDLKPEVTQGCGFESRLWQEVSMRWDPWARHKTPNCSLRRNFGCPLLQVGCVKCREHISLHIILCIIVYVTNKAHLSLICCWERALSRSCDQRLPTIIFWQCQKFSISHSVFAAMIHIYWLANKKATWNQRDIVLIHIAASYPVLFYFFQAYLKTTAAKSHLDIIAISCICTQTTHARDAADVKQACAEPCLPGEESNAHVLWYSPYWWNTWFGGEELNTFVIFVFFVHKKYSRSFVKLH